MLCIYILPTLIETQVTLWAVETSGYSVPFKPLLNAEHLADLIELTEVHSNYLQGSITVAGPDPQNIKNHMLQPWI